MAQAGMAEPEHTGTGTSRSSFGAQLNREGVQANWDTTELGHREETQPTWCGQSPPSLSDSGLTSVPVSVGGISKILWWGQLLLLHLK